MDNTEAKTVDQSTQPLTHITARAAMVSGTAEIVTRILTVVLTIVSARVLEPVEVGLLGLSVIVIGIVSILGSYPETAAVAASGDKGDGKFAFAAACVRAVILALSLVVLGTFFPAVARYLTNDATAAAPLRNLVLVLAWLPVVELLSGYPQVIFQRRLELNFIARLQILQPVLFVGLAVVMLITGRGYIGVAWANVASTAVICFLLWWRLLAAGSGLWGGWPSRRVWHETIHGTGKIFIGGFGGYLSGRVDNLIVSASIGPTAMSFYSMAWNASRTPANVFARAINFVLVPTLARIQDDPTRVQRALRECVRNSYLLLAPACSILFVTSPILVQYVIGPKWLPVIPVLRIMCFTVLAVPILYASGALLVGIGKAHLTGIATAVQLAVMLIVIPPMCKVWGTIGAAYADLIAVAILTSTLALTAFFSTRQIGWQVLKTAVIPLLAALISGFLALSLTNPIQSDLLRLVVGICVAAVGYLLVVAVVGGRARLLDLANMMRITVRRSSIQTAPEM
jgi:PST family polysaccharide transporter